MVFRKVGNKMVNYQEMYDKLKVQLENLEAKLLELKKEYCEREKEYSEVSYKLNDQEMDLSGLNNVKFKMLNSKHKSIELVLSVLLAVIVVLSGIALGKFAFTFISKEIPLSFLVSSVVTFVGTMCVFSALILGIMPMFEKRMKQRSSNKIINSLEYQEVLKKINELENDIKLTTDLKIRKSVEVCSIEEEYKPLEKEISTKKIVLNYIESEMNSQVKLKDEKSLVRKKVKNNNNGNLE